MYVYIYMLFRSQYAECAARTERASPPGVRGTGTVRAATELHLSGHVRQLASPMGATLPLSAFPELESIRREWDRDGVPTDGKDFLDRNNETKLDELERSLRNANMMTRWREAHPDLANTEQDCVRESITAIRRLWEKVWIV